MDIHPVANIFPTMSPDEYQTLLADIKTNGLLEPIWTYENQIIDGRHRHRACLEASITPQYRAWDGNGSLVGFVVSLNLNRRHLTSSQKAVVALEVERLLAVEAKERQREAAERTNAMRVGEAVTQIIAEASGEAREQAAQIVGTNRQYISDAKKLEKEAPDLLEEVKQGELTIPEAKALARLDKPKRKRARAKVKDKTAKNVRAAMREVAREDRAEQLKVAVFPTGKYGVIYADPPWLYEFAESDNRSLDNQYPQMTLDSICALPVSNISLDDSVLFLWSTSPKLAEAMRVIEAWGYVYRTCAVWDKEIIGMGYYFRQQHELLLLATRGSPSVPDPANRPASLFKERRGKHSVKPDLVYGLIERMYPGLPRVELFARQPHKGWVAYSNEL